MSIRQRMCLAALFFSALLLAACGAKQGKNVRITADWNALYDAIPADATYAVGYQIDKKGDVPAVLQGALGTVFDVSVSHFHHHFALIDLLQYNMIIAYVI